MRKISFLIIIAFIFLLSCKKQNGAENNHNNQLYPLATGSTWIYVDSFFESSGKYLGKDTFQIKPAKTIIFNNRIYTPLTDKYDDSIFILSSTDTTVHILNSVGEALIFRWPLDVSQLVIINSYHKDSLVSMIYTEKNILTAYPSYKVLIIRDDGQGQHYKQQELFFAIGIGVIKGRDIKKDNAGNLYTYDSYKLISFSLN